MGIYILTRVKKIGEGRWALAAKNVPYEIETTTEQHQHVIVKDIVTIWCSKLKYS